MGFLLWVICGFMVVKVGGCRGDGSGVAIGFGAKVSGVAMVKMTLVFNFGY